MTKEKTQKVGDATDSAQDAGSGFIDDDYHERFSELLNATRDWVCDRSAINEERILQATLSLQFYDPNPNA